MNSYNLVGITIILIVIARSQAETIHKSKCQIPILAPKNIAKVINQCQDEIKRALLTEAAELLKTEETEDEPEEDHVEVRRKRETFNDEERKIAGCLLQCVYRKMKAVGPTGFPTVEGLVALYTEGVTDKEYILATFQAVHVCLNDAQKKHITTPQSLSENGKTCDIAFDVFDCVSDRIGEYCGQTP